MRPTMASTTPSKKFPAFTPLGNGVCNSDLPNDSTLNRYLFVIQYYVSQVRTSACLVSHLGTTGLYMLMPGSQRYEALARHITICIAGTLRSGTLPWYHGV